MFLHTQISALITKCFVVKPLNLL